MCIMIELTNFEAIKSSTVYKAKKKETFYLVKSAEASTYNIYQSRMERRMTEVIASLLCYYAKEHQVIYRM